MTWITVLLAGLGAGAAMGGYRAYQKQRKQKYVHISVSTLKKRTAVEC